MNPWITWGLGNSLGKVLTKSLDLSVSVSKMKTSKKISMDPFSSDILGVSYVFFFAWKLRPDGIPDNHLEDFFKKIRRQ